MQHIFTVKVIFHNNFVLTVISVAHGEVVLLHRQTVPP